MNTVSESSSTNSPSRVSPWQMLPPSFVGGDDMAYNFYSLAEDKVIRIDKKKRGGEEEYSPDHAAATLVGSSHGWLALFNQKRNNDLFLWNPLSDRQIKLPPMDALPDPEINLRHGRGSVYKLVISCSPDDQECHALMIFGRGQRLAFCSPGRSTEWTPIGDLFEDKKEDVETKYGRPYEDFVYCSTHKLFTCITQELDWREKTEEMEDWDLLAGDPRIIWKEDVGLKAFEYDYDFGTCSDEFADLLRNKCQTTNYLVFGEQSDQLFLVKRFILCRMGPDGSYVEHQDTDDDHNLYPYKTVWFFAFKVDRKGRKMMQMHGNLDGLAMFIGNNHSFAISAADFPELKANSIYFTDYKLFTPPDDDAAQIYGGHDIAIFDYQNHTFAPCYYPTHVQTLKRIVPAPIWFTPTI